jgi:hypothetical protein
MLMRSHARRIAVALIVAFIAAVLVTAGGSSRPATARTSTGATPVATDASQGRYATDPAPTRADHQVFHLDLSSTPPADNPLVAAHDAWLPVASQSAPHPASAPARIGRAPPAV